MNLELAAHERYVFKPFLGSSHSWSIKKINDIIDKTNIQDFCVLDIGCGSGAIGQYLKERGLSDIHAVETDSKARDAVRDIYKSIHEDLTFYQNQKFDLILLLDVLEHLLEPSIFLKKVFEIVKPGGVVLISLPNVAHWSVRFSLLFGNFNYTERGILDRTHLHFFTRKTALALVNKISQTEICESNSSIEPIELLLPTWLYRNKIYEFFSKLRIFIARVCPGLFAFQHLIYAKKIG
jgi:2-polyprenyl-3-methyl-5-hydroxy-6-metoxy-1,4-benzoquinol methylase